MPAALQMAMTGAPYHFADDPSPAPNDVSFPVAIPRKQGPADGGRRISWGFKFLSASPATLNFRLQGTVCPDDTDPGALPVGLWTDLITITTTADQVSMLDVPKNVTHLRTFIQAITGSPGTLRSWILI